MDSQFYFFFEYKQPYVITKYAYNDVKFEKMFIKKKEPSIINPLQDLPLPEYDPDRKKELEEVMEFI